MSTWNGTVDFSSNGGKLETCYMGTAIFAGVALIISVVLTGYVGCNSSDASQKGTNMR
jgi:hypothetical protein